MSFCDRVNNELEGPQIAVRLLAHKIQSPQEREALHALAAIEACVQNCGGRLHQEIGKFRFLNELIKVVSPKVCLHFLCFCLYYSLFSNIHFCIVVVMCVYFFFSI